MRGGARWMWATACAAGLLLGTTGAQAAEPKVLRYAFPKAETGFDPLQVSDTYSRIITSHLFEAPLRYDPLARPFKLRTATAAAMPEVSADARTFTFHIQPGIYFQDDPVFKGRRRELVAQDYVYSVKRGFDPRVKSPGLSLLEDEGFIGLGELREEALKTGKPFDYDREVEGLRALDRYTFRVKLRESRPRHLYLWAARDVYAAAMAREVVEAYGSDIMAHPVGTGPFQLADWRRSSRMVLVRNPGYREVFYDAQPEADDAEGQALLQRLKGRRLPMIDRVEVSVIEEVQPRWLSFVKGEQDFLERTPEEYVDQAVPNGKLAPNLAKRGVQMYRVPAADITLTIFNMDDPTVGGYTPEKVALRRAMVLGDDVNREIELVRYGQAIPAQSIMPPLTTGYRADMRTEMSEFSPARAKALLDMYGYIDRDGDGWRERPDGQPLVLRLSTEAVQVTRRISELWKKNMDALGLRSELQIAQWPENLKSTRAGNFMIWRVGSSADKPDGHGALERVYGPAIGKGNLARFKLPAMDQVYDRLKVLPDGPERQQQFDLATQLLVAYAPYRLGVHRILTDLAYPQVIGYRRPLFWSDWWQYVDIEAPAATAH